MTFNPDLNPFDRARLECCPPEFHIDSVAPTIPQTYILAAESRLQRRDPIAYEVYRFNMGQLGHGTSAKKQLVRSLRKNFNMTLRPGFTERKRRFAIRFMRRRLRLYMWRARITEFVRALFGRSSRKELP